MVYIWNFAWEHFGIFLLNVVRDLGGDLFVVVFMKIYQVTIRVFSEVACAASF